VPRGTSLTDLLSYAYGPTLSSGSNRTKVKKIEVNVSRFSQASNSYRSQSFDFKMGKALPASMKNYGLQSGDVVTVKAKGKPRIREFVTIVTSVLSLGLTVYLAASR
jgi:protein involved in polysaccharide export with SLBB domain